jgi:hypothetical protein
MEDQKGEGHGKLLVDSSCRKVSMICRSYGALVLSVWILSACGNEEGGVVSSRDASPDFESESVGDVGADVGGDTSAVDAMDTPDVPAGPPVVLHDPSSGEFLSFPDDYFTVEDLTTLTGLRVRVDRENLPSIDSFPATFQSVFTSMSDLDGFGTTAGGFVRTSRPLDRTSVRENLLFGTIVDGEFGPRAFELKFTDDDATVIVRPLRPLPPTTRALIGFTAGVTGKGGLSAVPGPVLRSLLDGSAEGSLARMVPRYDEAVTALTAGGQIADRADIAALTLFTTQSIVAESQAVAADIQAREYAVGERLGCTDGPLFRECSFTFTSGNYRDDNRALDIDINDVQPVSFYDLIATVYLPIEPTEFGQPFPVILFGHGLGGERKQAARLAEFAAPLGLATIAIDAPEHGDHPARVGLGDLAVLYFFGFTPDFVMEGAALRDNWRQGTYDKLALVQLLLAGADVDGDEEVDLDGARICYLGVSLGGIMGPELLSLTSDIGAGILVVPGGRVTDILQFGSMFAPLLTFLTPADAGTGDVDRFWPILQTTIERGDPANYARHVLHERLAGPAPDLLMAMVLDDTVVPETTNLILARALDIPHVPPVLREIDGLTLASPPPLTGNLDGTTAGLLQFDVIVEDGQRVPAGHSNVGASEVGAHAWLEFIRAWLTNGRATIVDPYDDLGIEHGQ